MREASLALDSSPLAAAHVEAPLRAASLDSAPLAAAHVEEAPLRAVQISAVNEQVSNCIFAEIIVFKHEFIWFKLFAAIYF